MGLEYLQVLDEQAILLPLLRYFLTSNEPQSGQVSPVGSAQRAKEQSGYFEQPQKNVPYLDFLLTNSPSLPSSAHFGHLTPDDSTIEKRFLHLSFKHW